MNLKKKEKNIQQSIVQNKYTLDLVNQWIQHAENKASLLLAFFVAFAGIFQFTCSKLTIPNYTVTPIPFILFIIVLTLAFVFFISAISFFLMVIFPKLTGYNSSEYKYSIFFEDIAAFKSFDSYYKVVNKSDINKFNAEIIKEIYYNSVICSKKMKNIRQATICSIITSSFFILELLICLLA